MARRDLSSTTVVCAEPAAFSRRTERPEDGARSEDRRVVALPSARTPRSSPPSPRARAAPRGEEDVFSSFWCFPPGPGGFRPGPAPHGGRGAFDSAFRSAEGYFTPSARSMASTRP